ncbi:GTP 3',8-cyclase MoaA [Brevibacillus sp. SYSU BS000544]|uniref:GTP 3',8-cyclase MoaA n=1 Tax=Brevibacillus sp. SYSU BS000544 TaxID=3416443 RepID=UPI003CE4C2E8
MSGKLVDSFGRVHDYLRISITDRCNLRCMYCMPPKGTSFLPDQSLLTNEEIVKVVRVMAKMGISRVRLTGGEPLLRPDVESLVASLASIPTIRDISMTSNGLLLAKKAQKLKEAGLKRVNISLDSLKPERYSMITRGGDIQRVLNSIDECQRIGISPIKVNVVLIDGVNHDEIADFLRLSITLPIHVRFIEYMPIGSLKPWKNGFLPLDQVIQTCHMHDWNARPVQAENANGPARYYKIDGAKGQFGLIHAVSNHFCHSCNRLRLTSDGYLKGCLFWNDESYIRKWIDSETDMIEMIHRVLNQKPESHEMSKAYMLTHEDSMTVRSMSQIGG